MPDFTQPPVWEAQNSVRAIRLLAAQRQTYSDAKLIHFSRVSIILAAGLLISASTFLLNPFRPALGAATSITLLVLSIATSSREKRKIEHAAAMQEQFDSDIFQLPWPRTPTLDRPNASEVARAALRHRGGKLHDWYALRSQVVRPLDVLICQRANLGWGIATHRAWAATSLWLGVTLATLATVASLWADLSLAAAGIGVYAPLVPIFKELIEAWVTNSRSATIKEEADKEAARLWESAIKNGRPPSAAQCRKLQDKILEGRFTNSLIPDWFNGLLRNREESVMRLGTDEYVEQAAQKSLD